MRARVSPRPYISHRPNRGAIQHLNCCSSTIWGDRNAHLATLEHVAARPDMLFMALGSPRQEQWIAQHCPRLGVPVSIGVGGTFDVLAGLKPDAPAWARGRGLE